MAATWFYKLMGESIGPIRSAELKQLASNGTIDRGTLVRRSDREDWITADRVNGLFSPDGSAAKPQPDEQALSAADSSSDVDAEIVAPPAPIGPRPINSNPTPLVVLLLSPIVLAVLGFTFVIILETMQSILQNGIGGGASRESWPWILPLSFVLAVSATAAVIYVGFTKGTKEYRHELSEHEKKRKAYEIAYRDAHESTLNWIEQAESLVLSDATDAGLHSEIRRLSELWPSLREMTYRIALHTVEKSHGHTATKQLALHVGRAYHSSIRPDGCPTIYDEQAMQSDIESRVAGV